MMYTKIKKLKQLLEEHIDSDFTVGMGLASVIQDMGGYSINGGIHPQQRGEDKFHDGYFSGHKMHIDPKMTINDVRIIKENGSEINLKDYGIEFMDVI